MQLRAPRPHEAHLLTDLCLQSKAVWGYDDAFMQACRAELTIHPSDFQDGSFRVAIIDDTIVGVVQIAVDGDEAELAKLFVAPGAMGTGTGKMLFDWAANEARTRHAQWLWIESDPDAAPFYRRMGAIDSGTVPSGSIPGRVLPRLKLKL